jgi:hypothetical protein
MENSAGLKVRSLFSRKGKTKSKRKIRNISKGKREKS